MGFALGNNSNTILRTVNEPLSRIVRVAIELTDVDFSVVEGLRAIETQSRYVEQGKSWTLESDHLTGDAVDIYPWVGGKSSFHDEHFKRVAKAMFEASHELSIPVKWGGFWLNPKEDKPHWALWT